MKDTQIVISTKTILISLGLIGLFWVMYLVRDVLLLFFASLALALALDPLVDRLSKKRLSRGVATLLTLGFLVVVFTFLSTLVVNPLVQQTRLLYSQLPSYTERLLGDAGFSNTFNGTFIPEITKSTGNLLIVTRNAFSSLFSIIVAIVFTVYLLLDFDSIRNSFVRVFPKKEQAPLRKFLLRIESRLGGWLRGQLTLMFIVGLLTFIGLSILGIEEALALAVLAGLLEAIPIVGFVIALIPAVIIGFIVSPITGLAVLALYSIVQQLENNFIVPKVMQKAVGFNPLITMLVLLIGGKLFGLTGMLLAIPMTLVIHETFIYLREEGKW